MSKWLLTSLGAAVLLAGALAWRQLDSSAASSAKGALPGTASIEKVRPSRHRATASRAPTSDPTWVVAPAVSASAPAAQDSVELEPPRLSDDLHQYSEYLDVVFQGDQRDRAWEVEAEARLRNGLGKIRVPGSHVLSIECRASLCKTVIDSQDQDTLAKVSAQVLHSFFWTGPGMITRTSPESATDLRLVAFFGREGQELPDG
jgi:hypothetical protein